MRGYYNVYEKKYNGNMKDLDTYYVLYDERTKLKRIKRGANFF